MNKSQSGFYKITSNYFLKRNWVEIVTKLCYSGVMKMEVEDTEFGSITVEGKNYDHDVVVFPTKVVDRKKWITKNKHGTSHKFTREEMQEYLEKVNPEEIETIIVGTGQYGKLGLLDETKRLLKEKNIEPVELKTPEAIKRYDSKEKSKKRKIGIFHVTC